MAPGIEEIIPSATTVVADAFGKPDYRDAFLVKQPGHATVADFATAFFLHQPGWLARVSMNLRNRKHTLEALGDRTYAEGGSVGSWRIHARNDDEIVFGEDMGFMEYWLSFHLRPSGDVEASTVVRYSSPRLSRLYFGIVKPMHRRFLPRALRAGQQRLPAAEVAA